MTQHTPGPWTAHGNMKATTPLVQSAERLVARMPGTTEVDEANARLIAAAPKLLEALEAIGKRLYDNETLSPADELAILDIMRPAIAEAKGELDK